MQQETNSTIAEIQISYHPNIIGEASVTTAAEAFKYFINSYSADTISLQETVKVMYLNRANKVLGIYEASKGGITGTVVDIRLLMGVAVKSAATSMILCHNHPSGSLKPSTQDISLTTEILEAGKLLNISLLDHLIISRDNIYRSMAESGDLVF